MIILEKTSGDLCTPTRAVLLCRPGKRQGLPLLLVATSSEVKQCTTAGRTVHSHTAWPLLGFIKKTLAIKERKNESSLLIHSLALCFLSKRPWTQEPCPPEALCGKTTPGGQEAWAGQVPVPGVRSLPWGWAFRQ